MSDRAAMLVTAVLILLLGMLYASDSVIRHALTK